MAGQPEYMKPRIHGAFAALVTPIDDLGRADLPAFERLIDFILERGLDGIIVGGATGEYAHFTVDERLQIAAHAIERVGGRSKVLTCIGTSSIHSTLRLAGRAAGLENEALLLPMPYFFRYEQQDLSAFVEEVCGAVNVPFLLYNLPVFTNPLEPATAVDLFRRIPNLIGMKDSSGDRSNLSTLAGARVDGEFSLLVGDDSLLLSAARAGWDGVISGIACFAPELIGAVYRSHRDGHLKDALRFQAMLDEIIEWVVRIPIPWAVRVGLAARGIPNGPMHSPVSAGRAQRIEEFRQWFERWTAGHGLELEGVWARPRCSE
jgi:4-hydroxy-tetrahydrodipicolinate synthase